VPDIKPGAPFGMDVPTISKIDWHLAISRIRHDQRTDFIYAPHLNFIYNKAKDDLVEQVTSSLRSGKYIPGVPLTIEVPKSFRIRMAVSPRRLGPSFLGRAAFFCRTTACSIKRLLMKLHRSSAPEPTRRDPLAIS
jgi:hypothetical protein